MPGPPINVQLQPGESIEEALIRAELITPLEKGPRETITIPPGVSIIGPNLKQTHIIEQSYPVIIPHIAFLCLTSKLLLATLLTTFTFY